MDDYSQIIKVLDTDLYLRVRQFVAYKGVGLFWVAILLERGKIPFDSLDIDDVKQLTNLSRFMLISDEELQKRESDSLIDSLQYTEEAFLPWYDRVSEIMKRLNENSFEIELLFNQEEKTLNPDQLQRLRDFLRRNDLKQHLVDAKKDMTAIKDFIVTNFSVVDLMIDIGSDQLKKRLPPE